MNPSPSTEYPETGPDSSRLPRSVWTQWSEWTEWAVWTEWIERTEWTQWIEWTERAMWTEWIERTEWTQWIEWTERAVWTEWIERIERTQWTRSGVQAPETGRPPPRPSQFSILISHFSSLNSPFPFTPLRPQRPARKTERPLRRHLTPKRPGIRYPVSR